MNFDGSFEDDVLAQSLSDEGFLKRASRICQAHHFSTRERAWLWKVIHDIWSKYSERTSKKIVVARATHEFSDKDKRKPYLLFAKKIFSRKPKSPKAVLEELDGFVRYVSLQLALEESATLLGKGKIDEAEIAIRKGSRSVTRQRNYSHISWVEEFEDRQVQRKYEKDHPEEFSAIPIGFPTIDRAMSGGLRKGEFALISATTGRGKSIFLTNAVHSCISRGNNAIYLAFEMPARQIAARQDARWSGHQYDKFKKFEFKPSELRELGRRLKKARKQFMNRLHIISMPVRSATFVDVRNAISDVREEYGFEADAIFMDSCDHIRSMDSYGGNYRLQQSEVYWSAKEMAEEDGYVVMSSTQAGKEWATKIATAEAPSESYDKSRIADAVMSLNDPAEMRGGGRQTIITDEEDDDDEEEIEESVLKRGQRLMDLYLGKYRDGDSRIKVPVVADFPVMSMRELDDKDRE